MTPVRHVWTTHAPEETHRLGVCLGELLEPRDYVALVGDLGAGKTALVRGIAEGAKVPEEDVTSPTFAVINAYRGRVAVYHADLYRLSDADELCAVGYDDLLQSDAAWMVEWMDRIPTAAPADRLWVTLEGDGERERTLTAEAQGTRSQALLSAWVVAFQARR